MKKNFNELTFFLVITPESIIEFDLNHYVILTRVQVSIEHVLYGLLY